MKASIRISIAYILGSLISKGTFNNILAKTENQYVKFSGRFDQSNIDIEEYETGNKCFGMINGDNGSFVHEGENASINFKVIGNSFSGSDSDSGKNFSGNINGKTVNLYDGEECKTFYYYFFE